jgi:putative NADH-flavin reductase
MRTALKATAEILLMGCGLARLSTLRKRTGALVLAYHNIVPDGHASSIGERSLHLPQRTFAAHLDILARYCEVVPLDAILDETPSETRDRPRVAITFDDAYRGAATAGVDELSMRGMPATIFVTAYDRYALDAFEVEAAVAGQDAVLSALGTRSARRTTLFSESTHNLISAMDKHGVRRLVCITGIGVGDSKGHVGFLYDRVFLPLVLRNPYEDKERQEEILRGSGLEWVIVRPARLTNKRATCEYQVFLSGDSYKATTISREDVAEFMLAKLREDRYVHKTPVISY